jgi:CheY-like chemotaxis protein
MANVATHRQIAVVLEELSQDVEALGGKLCVDMDIAMRHMDTLQAIDLIAQKQRSLASLLNSDCPEAGIEQIAIDTLRDRMRRPR